MKMNKTSIYLILVALMPMFFYQNCGKPSDLQYSSTFDLSSQLGAQEASLIILQKNCASCHSSSNMSGNVGDITDLDYLTYSRLIIPGEPELSPIINQITQGLMPVGMPALSGAEVEILKQWITGLNKVPEGGGGGVIPTQIEPRFSVLSQQIFTARCATCHANRNFRFGNYNEVIRSVVPGNAANSILFRSVTVGATGGRMPQGGGLSAAQIKAIEDWINQGAQNN